MNLFPSDEVSRFHLFSVLFLVAILASTFISAAAFVIALLAFCGLCILFARGLPESQRAPGYTLFAVFALFGVGALALRECARTPSDLLFALPIVATCFFVLFVILKAFLVPSRVECKVLGYSEGYAIVETYPAILSVMPPGTYAVRSSPVKKGKAGFVVVQKKLFGSSPKISRLEIA